MAGGRKGAGQRQGGGPSHRTTNVVANTACNGAAVGCAGHRAGTAITPKDYGLAGRRGHGVGETKATDQRRAVVGHGHVIRDVVVGGRRTDGGRSRVVTQRVDEVGIVDECIDCGRVNGQRGSFAIVAVVGTSRVFLY